MATRFRLTADTTAPAVSPALQTYTHTQTTRRKLLTSDSSTLTTSSYTPDAVDHLVAGDAHHIQFVSDPMSAGIVFTNGNVIKLAILCSEDNTANNLFIQLYITVVDSTGGTVQRVLRSKAADNTEMTNTLQNRTFSTTQDGATYTTVANDRLAVEFSATGTVASGGGTNGHNATFRWGSSGTGDLPEDDTTTTTTLNPWIEFIPTITFGGAAQIWQPPSLKTNQAVQRASVY